jgi:hypothetical protein
MLLALLLPDPCDGICPDDFKTRARELLTKVQGRPGPRDQELRQALLKFVGDFADWDLSTNATYLEVCRGLVLAACGQEPPFVVDPFAGGGSIPLEASRLGCEAFASDLNPVACLILKVLLEDLPRYGSTLNEELLRAGKQIKEAAEKELAPFYPSDPDGARPIAYVWARTVRCESPNCGAEIPLIRSFWLSKKASRRRAISHTVTRVDGEPPRVEFDIIEPKSESDVRGGTVSRAKARCLACNVVLGAERVRAQLAAQRGGANVVFDENGRRLAGPRMLAVVTLKEGEQGRRYRLPSDQDYDVVLCAMKRLDQIVATRQPGGLSPVPDETTPAGGGSGAGRAFSVQKYGMMTFADLFSGRQQVALATFAILIRAAKDWPPLVRCLLALNLTHVLERNTSLCRWYPHAYMETVGSIYGRQALPMVWDFAEAVPLTDSTGSWLHSLAVSTHTVGLASLSLTSTVQTNLADARESPLPDDCAAVWFTDPPYYDAVPYADLSDFFFCWLKRTLPDGWLVRDLFDSANPLTPKTREIVQDETKSEEGRPKDRMFFERAMRRAFADGRRVLTEDGIACVVFAHKTTEGWEALLSGMVRAGWVITASWPISTERAARIRARESAALATSVHLVCRPRSDDAVIGDWGQILGALPRHVGDWMGRLQKEGIHGADLVFACIGPALELYSRFSKVVDAEEREIPLGGDPLAVPPHERGYLTYVWEAVGRAALAQVLGGGETQAGQGTALEEDARLTALFLWTLQSTNGSVAEAEITHEEEEDDDSEDENHEEQGRAKKTRGYSLIFDVVRRFAQPLGIRLPDWEGRIIETKKGVVRLLPVTERAEQLFGSEGAQAVADRLEQRPSAAPQLTLFPTREERVQVKSRRRTRQARAETSDESLHTRREATTLDRVHAAMLLQAAGRANALRTLLKAEQERGPEFVRLANALSALYPKGSEEKRLLDAMLLAVPR